MEYWLIPSGNQTWQRDIHSKFVGFPNLNVREFPCQATIATAPISDSYTSSLFPDEELAVPEGTTTLSEPCGLGPISDR